MTHPGPQTSHRAAGQAALRSAFDPAAAPAMVRHLKAFIDTQVPVTTMLKRLQEGLVTDLSDDAALAILCAAYDRPYPPNDDDRSFLFPRLDRAGSPEMARHISLALEAVEHAVAVTRSAMCSLRIADAIGEPIPVAWRNLAPMDLARKCNRLGHTILRGRVPGWSHGA